jgi:hypothetical protein
LQEFAVRSGLAIAVGFLALAGCGKPQGAVDAGPASQAAPPPQNAMVSSSPYTGEWAAAAEACSDDKQVWTIEAHRMAIVPAMRFCAFKDIYVNKASAKGATTFSAAASCLAEGHETNDFVFFRVKDNLREMRVTFNDTDAVKLVRCPLKS